MSTEISTDEQAWVDLAVAAATKNVASGGGPFGALVMRDGEILATGTNLVTPNLDPTAHAEVTAIRAACQLIGDFKLTGCVLVASCEPCPLCLSAALWSRVDKVVYGADRDDAAHAGFDDRLFYEFFATPREQWPLSVGQVRTPNVTAPFEEWNASPSRVEY